MRTEAGATAESLGTVLNALERSRQFTYLLIAAGPRHEIRTR